MKNSDMPAMPIFGEDGMPTAHDEDAPNEFMTGLTKLEHFAGLAMQGILANPKFIDVFDDGHIQPAADLEKWAAGSAQRLLAELEKQK
jgi:hypothetical protein